ncbi:MAG: MMPL family transporter [Planctomycetaceae bacterium]
MLKQIVAYRWWGLGLAALLSLLAIRPASKLELDERIESFYAEDDPLLMRYLLSKETFGGDEFVMVAYRLEAPLDLDVSLELEPQSSILEQLKQLSSKLSQVQGVRPESTQDIERVVHNQAARRLAPLGATRLTGVVKQMVAPGYQILISRDHAVLTILLRLEPAEQAPVSRKETFAEIRRIAEEFPLKAYVAGEPIQVHDMFRYVEADGWILGTTSTILLTLVILLMFRSIRWVVLPLIVVHATLLWTKALLQISGLKLSMVSSMLTSLVTIIAIATVMHITVVFREERKRHNRQDALLQTLLQLWAPIFWTCLTTAVGFASLLTSGITPVRSFGIMMGLGTLMVPVSCLLILPAGILAGAFDTDPKPVVAEAALMQSLSRISAWITRSRRTVLVSAGVIIVFAIAGLNHLQVETDFSKNFRSQSDIVQSLQFFESTMGGVGTWEVSFPAPNELTEDYLSRVSRLSEKLRALHIESDIQLTRIVDLSDGIEPMRELRKRERGAFGLPKYRRRDFGEAREALNEIQPEMEPSLYNAQAGRMRIMLRALEQQPAEKKLRLIAEVERLAREEFPEAETTGLYVLLAELISSLLRDQITSFVLTCTLIGLFMGLAFRNAWMGLVSLVPNVLPIVVVIGGMGWVGIPINIGTAMIASVSMGLTIDSTIHYLTGYTRRIQAGLSHDDALAETHADVGRVLIFANIALVTGFTVLTLSQFIPLVYFGVLVSVAMIGGLLGNLILLPAMLKVPSVEAVSPAADGEQGSTVI